MFHCLPNSAQANGNLAGLAGQLGKMWNTQIKVNPTQVLDHQPHPVVNDFHFKPTEALKTLAEVHDHPVISIREINLDIGPAVMSSNCLFLSQEPVARLATSSVS